MTRQRAVILDVLRSDGHHMTAEEIFAFSKIKLPGISRATVYNNLNALVDEGFIRKISGVEAADRYDLTTAPHAHLFCKSCNGIYDIHLPDIEALIEESEKIKLTEYELKLTGVCKKCLANNKI